MFRSLCLVLLFSWMLPAAFAAEVDPVVKHYDDTLEALRNRPEDGALVLSLLPPGRPPTAEQRAALNRVVQFVESQAAKQPKHYVRQHNLYTALWKRYQFLGDVADAERARTQALVALELAEPGSNERAQCSYEYALTGLGLRSEHVAKVLGDSPVEANIEAFRMAMRSTMNQGPYVPLISLQLGKLYLAQGAKDEAERYLREALTLDRTSKGYISNQAYDVIGCMRLDADKVEAAETMLKSAGEVEMDDDLTARGFALALAEKLNEKGRYKAVTDYLKKTYQMAKAAEGLIQPELVYHLALAHTMQGHSDEAIIRWQEYMGMPDPNAARRKAAREFARKLAVRAGR
jgi:tetratricopeptide (TPR) repeat protein